MEKKKKILSISGGGNKGSWAGGIAQYLYETGNDYDVFIGTSTGSLIIPFLASGKIDNLREAYTNIKPKDIFKVNPFTKNGKINVFNVLRNLIKGQATLGDSSNLRKTISVFFTKDDYNKILESGKEIIVCVSNLTTEEKEFKSIKDYSYEDMCDWIWISTCAVPFMSLVEKDGFEYVDGGLYESIAIEKGVELGADVIDAIILSSEFKSENNSKTKNIFKLMSRLISTMMDNIRKDDINIGSVKSENKNIDLNLYYTPRDLTSNPLIFDSELMNSWWIEAYKKMSDGYNCKKCQITKKGLISK